MVVICDSAKAMLDRMGLPSSSMHSVIKQDTSNLETLLHAVVAALGDALGKMESSDKKMKEMEARIGVVEAQGPRDDTGPAIDLATISNLEAGLAAVSSRVLILEDKSTIETVTQDAFEVAMAAHTQALKDVENRLNELAQDSQLLKERAERCEDDIREKVDVTSLEPLRLADKQLSTQLAELERQLRDQLATKEAVELAVEPLATRDLLRSFVSNGVFESSQNKVEQQIKSLGLELSRLVQAMQNLQLPTPTDDGDDELMAGFMYPIKCMSCSRTKSPGRRATSPVREVQGSDGVIYGNAGNSVRPGSARATGRPSASPQPLKSTANTQRRTRPKSAAVSRNLGSEGRTEGAKTATRPKTPKLPEKRTVDPYMSQAELMMQNGIEAEPSRAAANTAGRQQKVAPPRPGGVVHNVPYVSHGNKW